MLLLACFLNLTSLINLNNTISAFFFLNYFTRKSLASLRLPHKRSMSSEWKYEAIAEQGRRALGQCLLFGSKACSLRSSGRASKRKRESKRESEWVVDFLLISAGTSGIVLAQGSCSLADNGNNGLILFFIHTYFYFFFYFILFYFILGLDFSSDDILGSQTAENILENVANAFACRLLQFPCVGPKRFGIAESYSTGA